MRFSRFFLIPLLALLSSASHLQAGTPSDKNAPPQPVTIAPTISPWDVTFTGYGWMSGIDAQMAVNGYTASTSFGVDDILRNLDRIAMFNVEIRRGLCNAAHRECRRAQSSHSFLAVCPPTADDSSFAGSSTVLFNSLQKTGSARSAETQKVGSRASAPDLCYAQSTGSCHHPALAPQRRCAVAYPPRCK